MSNETAKINYGFTVPDVLLHLSLFVGVVGFSFNLLVCMVFLRKCMRKSYARHYYISLAFGDMLYSMVAIMVGIPGLLSRNKNICEWFVLIDYTGYYGAMNSMILLAAERLCAIKYPTFFKTWTKKRNIRIQITLIWIYSCIVTVYPLTRAELIPEQLDKNTSTMTCSVPDEHGIRVYHLIFDILIPISLVLCFSTCTIHALKKRSTISTFHGSNEDRTVKSLNKPWLQLTFILVMFGICFGPFCLTSLLHMINDTTFNSWTGFLFQSVLYLLTFIHTWLNPIMLWVCDKEFQEISKRTFCGKCMKSKDNRGEERTNTTT